MLLCFYAFCDNLLTGCPAAGLRCLKISLLLQQPSRLMRKVFPLTVILAEMVVFATVWIECCRLRLVLSERGVNPHQNQKKVFWEQFHGEFYGWVPVPD